MKIKVMTAMENSASTFAAASITQAENTKYEPGSHRYVLLEGAIW
jgi:hypothetical protein